MRKFLYTIWFIVFFPAVAIAGVHNPPVSVSESDGSPTVWSPWQIKFPNGSVTDNGDGTVSVTFSSSSTSLGDLSDVSITSPSSGQLLKFDGTEWVNWTPNYLTSETDPVFSDMDTEAELESHLTDVTNIYTNNDGALTEDDLSDNVISDLSNVTITTPSSGQVLKYDGSKWVNSTDDTGTDDLDDLSDNSITDLSDVSVTTPSSGQYIRYDGTEWVNSAVQDSDLPSSITRDTEWDTITEIETVTGVDIITSTENNDSDDDLSDNSITDLSDVSITSVADGQLLKYDSTDGAWENWTPDYLTSADALLLDQTTAQTISNGVPLLNETPTGAADIKSLVNKEYVDLAVTSLGATYYMYDEDDATGYKTCYLDPSSSSEVYIEKSSLSDDDYIGGWISASGEAPNKLLKGVYNWYITMEKTGGTKTLKVYWKLYERKSDSTEVLVATSSNSNEINGKATYLVPLQLDDDYIPDSGSRIVGKLYADVSGGGSSPTIRVYYQGNTSSRWEIPANSEIFKNIFVPYDGAMQDVDLGSYDLTTTGTIDGGAVKVNGVDVLTSESDPDFNAMDTEAELESHLTDVTNVYTNNDGNLTDDDLSDNTTDDLAEGTTNKYCTLTNIQSACSNDFHNIGGIDDDQPDDDSEVPDILSLTKIPNLTTNGFIKTSNGDGTLTIDTNTYLTSESDPVWSSDKTDYYTKTDLQTSGSASVHWDNLTNKPTNLDTDSTDDLTTSTSFSGDVSGAYNNLQLGSGVVGTAEISDGSITADDLDTYNVAASGYFLQYDSTNGLQWVEVQAGGGDITAVGDVGSGDAFTADGGGNTLYFEGATADAYETILQGQDVTSDVTVNLPNSSGTLLNKEQIDTEAEFESLLFSVFTPSDGSLNDDDLSDNNLTDLSDVTISSVADGQLLKYNSTTSQWENWTPNYLTSESDPIFSAMDTETELESQLTDVTDVYTNNDGNLTDDDLSDNSIDDLSDVTITTVSDGQLLKYNSTSGVWENWTPNYLTAESDPVFSAMDTEAELESQLSDVTDVYTNNDGSLDDDDLSDNVISDLSNVAISSPSSGQVLKYNGTNWVNSADDTGTDTLDDLSDNNLTDLSDVAISTPSAGQYVRYDGSNWVNSSVQDSDLPASVTRDSEWDTQGEVESIWGVTLATDSELSSHANTTSGIHGVSGDIVGTTDTQTLTNKTFTDSSTYFQDETDNTKKLQFQLSSISTSTTRVWTVPDADGEVSLLGQTIGTSEVESGITLDTEWDTIGEIETATGVDIITSTENNDDADDLSDNSISDLNDVSVTSPSSGQVLKYNGTAWVNDTDNDTTYSAGTGLNLSGTTFSLSHLGLESLTDPNANRLYYWNDTNNATEWLDYSGWDTDASDDFSGSWNDLTDIPAGFADGVDDVDDADADSTNELQNIFQSVSDGTNTATADGTSDILRFRSADSLLTITVTNDDATYGDNILFDVNDNLSAYNNDAGFLTSESDPDFAAMDTEAELESHLTDVSDVYTNNDGSLTDDDLSDNNLTDLSDVSISTPSSGQVLKYNGTAWVNGVDDTGTDSADDLSDNSISDLSDVSVSSPSDGEVLTYDSASGVWKNKNLPVDSSTLATLEQNILLNAFRIAVNGSLTQFGMVDGIMDEFEDESGVDTGASENETYDSSNDLYYPYESVSNEDPTSDMLSQSGLSSFDATACVDNDTGTNAFHTDTSSAGAWLQVDLGTGNDKGYTRLKLYTSADGSNSVWDIQYSDDGSSWSTAYSGFNPSSSGWNEVSWNSVGSHRYWRLYLTNTPGSGPWITEMEWYTGARQNMTLISQSFTAESQPDEVRLVLFEEDVDTITVNTDLKAYISRDGGTTWSQVTLSDEGDYASSKRILSGSVDVSGQPSGTSMKWKVVTDNNKNLKLHGVGMLWK